MSIKKKILALLALFVLLAFTGLAGCKNVCEKSVDKMIDCMREYCDEHPDEGECENLDEEIDEAREEANERMGECTDEMKAGAEQLLDMECEQLIEML
jgi:hypothetical protein